MATEYSTAGWSAAHQGLLSLVIAASGSATANIYDSADVLLAQAIIDKANSEVELDGSLVFVISVQDADAAASGVADYITIADGAATVHIRLPCKEGTIPEAGWFVMNTTSIVAGLPVVINSFEILPGAVIA